MVLKGTVSRAVQPLYFRSPGPSRRFVIILFCHPDRSRRFDGGAEGPAFRHFQPDIAKRRWFVCSLEPSALSAYYAGAFAFMPTPYPCNPWLSLSFARIFSVLSVFSVVSWPFCQRHGRTLMFPRLAVIVLLACIVPASPSAHAQQPPSTAPAPAGDRIAQMRADLNQMESLMGNMQSEINFLRDQNLQILLNTNVRMWTILIRDLRRQLDDEERRGTNPLSAPPKPALPK
jgi:hypothetical protein